MFNRLYFPESWAPSICILRSFLDRQKCIKLKKQANEILTPNFYKGRGLFFQKIKGFLKCLEFYIILFLRETHEKHTESFRSEKIDMFYSF